MMRIEDCRTAELLYKERESWYTVLNSPDYNYVETQKFYVGVSAVTLKLPWALCKDLIEKRILDIEAWLTTHGIEYDV
jgi:hypothetical protein